MLSNHLALAAAMASLTLLAVPTLAVAEDLSTDAIIDRVLERNAFGFENAISQLELTLTSKRGKVRQRKVEIRSLREKELTKTLVRFHAPAEVAGTGFLVVENQDRDDDQYLFLPAIGKTKRISAVQREQKFMGTDLTYADLESRNLKDSATKKLPDATIGGNPTYVLESFPNKPKDSQYGKTISWIHKKTFVALKVEFYDKKMKLLKTLTVAEVRKKGDSWVVWDSTISNIKTKTKTRMKVDSLDTKVKLDASLFTKRALEED